MTFIIICPNIDCIFIFVKVKYSFKCLLNYKLIMLSAKNGVLL